ncbi:MAG TPA: chorismate synthase [Chitinophagaceae bacterium]|nr:chorismate synthase [Chitinophagaceae bacterium]
MNTLGKQLKLHIYGASHGPEVGVLLEGVPAGILITFDDFQEAIARRQPTMRGSTPRKEKDRILIRSGLKSGLTTGAPILLSILNENIRSADYENQRAIPRPGHADWGAHVKYKGYEDYRGGGMFSARLTVGIVAAGVVAEKVIKHYLKWDAYQVSSKILQVGKYEDVEKGLEAAIAAKDSVGGKIQITIDGIPTGIGEPYFYGLDAALGQAIFSVPAVKGLEFGAGFDSLNMYGSEHNDAIIDATGATATQNAGGVVGGLSNGNPLQFQVVVKPTSSTPQVQNSYNWEEKKSMEFSIKGRHDLCVALRAPVILESITSWVLADLGLMYKELPYAPSKEYYL